MSAWSPPAAEKRGSPLGRGSAKLSETLIEGRDQAFGKKCFLILSPNLLLGPLDHAVVLAGVARYHFAGGSHLEALLRLTWFFSLGIWLSYGGNTKTP
ncbi:hypothetical protein M2175_003893 [Bradyrhizobium elkanii]|nr:hypothetical protein [Bradyrhizobium elkanii]MCS3969416.1 hypothetical protein [Bradyrhizobium japonicum]